MNYKLLVTLMSLFFVKTPEPSYWEKRMVRIGVNHGSDDKVSRAIEVMERAKKANYNGVIMSDLRTPWWWKENPRFAERWRANAKFVRNKALQLGLEYIISVIHFGGAGGILHSDVNLAAGHPIVDAPLKAQGGKLIPIQNASIRNGSFEIYSDNRFDGWFHDNPGVVSFVDESVVKDGNASIRFENISANPHGNARVIQKLNVVKYQQYRLRFWVKMLSLSGRFSVTVRKADMSRLLQKQHYTEPSEQSGYFHQFLKNKTSDWCEQTIVFNSLDSTQVNIYIGIGVGTQGKFWIDDVRIDCVPTLNILRRKSLPIKIASADTVYEEGTDFQKIVDPPLGQEPWLGAYGVYHEAPQIELTADSRIRDGQEVKLSCYHALTMPGAEINCSMVEEKVYDICTDEVKHARDVLNPDGYLLNHDEIRTGGWEPNEIARFKTSGELFAYSIRRCFDIISKNDKRKPVYVWSDMFDPYHNARENYYLVNNTIEGSWEGLDRAIIIIEWHPEGDGVRFFEKRGHKQVISGYTYEDVEGDYTKWMERIGDAKGVIGTCFCTWTGWSDLEKFANVWWNGINMPPPGKPDGKASSSQ